MLNKETCNQSTMCLLKWLSLQKQFMGYTKHTLAWASGMKENSAVLYAN